MGDSAGSGLTGDQIKKGLAILAAFIVLRLIGMWIWERYFGAEYRVTLEFLLFLFGIFLVMSVGLVYLGFARWLGVDLKGWWFRREKVWGDLAWGLGTLIGLIPVVIAGGLVLYALDLTPEKLGVDTSTQPSLADLPAILLMGWFFGFAIAAFQEETLFRGFLQGIFEERTGPWRANFLQALCFSLAHLGLDGFESIGHATFLLVFRFAFGILFGWLRLHRGSLLAPAIVHGFIG